MSSTPYLTLEEARAMIDRGLAKAREIHQAAAIVVVDAGGNVVSISRMDDSPLASVHVSRAKAYVAAVQGRPTATFAASARERPEIFSAFQTLLPHHPFPGPGGMPILKNGRVVGGIATGGGIGPYTEILGVDPVKLMVDGVQANAEDLVICAALGIPYASQHGDRQVGDSRPPVPVGVGKGGEAGASAVDGALPLGLDEARRYADRAIQHAAEVGAPIGVAVVDEMGRLVQVDRMDQSALVSGDLAEAKAMTALKFRRPTSALTEEFRGHSARIQAVEKIVRFTILAMGGGIPIMKEGRLVGAIGVSGSGATAPQHDGRRVNDTDIATAALALSV